jgi:signal transduction histidine kinase/ActR/RegA family two-component response regulator
MVTPEASLSTVPASAAQRRQAFGAIALSALIFVALAPFAKVAQPPHQGFIPTYQSVLIAADVMTALILYSQYHALRLPSLFVLATGYLFTAFAATLHMLTFPGLFSPNGLFGARAQTTAWMYMFWHAGFPLFVIGYAWLKDREELEPATVSASVTAMIVGAGAVFGVAGAFLLLATAGHDSLPAIMNGSRYTQAMIIVITSVWVLSLVAMAAVWLKPKRTILDLWLMVVMGAWLCDIALSAMLNGGRFDLGFYFGRLYGLLAAGLVLGVLLLEHARLLGRLARSHDALRAEQEGLAAANGELQAAREAAVAADRAKDVFLATMSHEIRTPMNGVLGLLELLSLTELRAEQRSQVDTIRESAQSLLRIIDDLLDFSKIEAGRLEVFPEAASVPRIVSLVAEGFRGAASAKKLVLEYRVDKQISPALWVDGLRLRQILNNLLSNAIKFTEDGKVTVSAELIARQDDEELVRFDVRDTGIGIRAEDQEKLFQPFTQVARDTNRRFGGTGLGLSICRRLAEMMGGEIRLQSAVGEGTTVSLILRMKRVAAEPAAPPAQPALAGGVVRRTCPSVEDAERDGCLVLAADDHPINRMVLQRQLANIGYASEAAENGREALELWRTGRFALLVTDCHMPELDGYQLTRAIREEEVLGGKGHVPIIAFTANAMAGEAEQCYAAGMDDYLEKPVQIAELAAKLNVWLPLKATSG